MQVGRVTLYGGLLGGAAAWVYLASEGLISAAGLFVALFDLLVVFGVLLAVLTENVSKQTWSSVAASVRTIKHRNAVSEICSVCARFIVDTGAARVCPTCDRIPAVLTP